MPDIPGLWSLTPLGALVGVIVMIAVTLVRGYFIPRSSHERELGLAHKRGDEWKETAVSVRAVNAELLRQNSAIIESNRITDHFFRSVTGDKEPIDADTSPTRGRNVAS